jgi:hypothetical protein
VRYDADPAEKPLVPEHDDSPSLPAASRVQLCCQYAGVEMKNRHQMEWFFDTTTVGWAHSYAARKTFPQQFREPDHLAQLRAGYLTPMCESLQFPVGGFHFRGSLRKF